MQNGGEKPNVIVDRAGHVRVMWGDRTLRVYDSWSSNTPVSDPEQLAHISIERLDKSLFPSIESRPSFTGGPKSLFGPADGFLASKRG
jgi:hypothetical protein